MSSLEQMAGISEEIAVHYTAYAGFAVDYRGDSASPRNDQFLVALLLSCDHICSDYTLSCIKKL